MDLLGDDAETVVTMIKVYVEQDKAEISLIEIEGDQESLMLFSNLCLEALFDGYCDGRIISDSGKTTIIKIKRNGKLS